MAHRFFVSAFHLVTLAGWLVVPIGAWVARGRLYATFAGVMLGLYSLLAIGVAPLVAASLPYLIAPRFGVPWPLLWMHATVYLHFLLLVRPRMRPLAFRVLVSIPASFFVAATFLALPWALLSALGFHPWGVAVPFALAFVGLVQSLATRETEIDLALDDVHVEGPRPYRAAAHRTERPLHVVQISDPHLGPFMSVERLAGICRRAVAKNPDLIVLTGDFLTMESQHDPRHLEAALAPLKTLEGRVFACMGNHDHEAPVLVRDALARNAVRLLVDEAVEIETSAGPVQILGMDYHFRDRARRIADVCARWPRKAGALRLVLLHDPWAFRHVPEGEGDLVLAGHTHGGQVGLVSLGASWTFLRLFGGGALPDHGLWARGRDRLYVHRGTGHYGFPLRLGVPSEEGLIRVHRAPA
jgi:predicted MPP superfamily phosphohydrolase